MVLYEKLKELGEGQATVRATPTFYIDDSSVDLDGRRHVLLAALRFESDGIATSAILECKKVLGLEAHEEMKWNAKGVSRQQAYAIRNAMLTVLSDARGTIVIHEGSKTAAAAALAIQLSDYSREQGAPGFVCRFDRDIIETSSFFADAGNLEPPCVGVSVHDSHLDQLIQAADLFAGFQKLRIDIGTGRVNGDRLIQEDVYEENEQREYPMAWYLSLSLRPCLWGRWEGDVEPTKVNLGLGVRVFSSAPDSTVKAALRFLGEEFMGCIH